MAATAPIAPRRATLTCQLTALSLCLALAACTPDNGTDTDVTITKVERPVWVDTGHHPAFPGDTHLSVVHIPGGPDVPGRAPMLNRLCAKLQDEIRVRVTPEKGSTLESCMKNGAWVTTALLPEKDIQVQGWTDGFASAAVAGISRAAVASHARQLLERWQTVLAADPALWTRRATALDDMSGRVRALARATDELALRALALCDRNDAAGVDPAMVRRAERIAGIAVEFREFLGCRVISGPEPSATLGQKLKPMEFQFVWLGTAADGLPVRPLTASQETSADRTTDAAGIARISFTAPVLYTGLARNEIGFDLDWGMLVAGSDPGLSTLPYTTVLTLPSAENVVVVLRFTEKNLQETLTDGPIRRGLREQLSEAAMIVLDEPPEKDDPRFVLEIGGVMSVTELDRTGTSAIRQVRARGSLDLRTRGGGIIATCAGIEGIASFQAPDDPDDRLEREARAGSAGVRALDDAWGLYRRKLSFEFRQAFPPIFRPSTAEGGPR